MRYNISKASAPKMLNLEKGQKHPKTPQKSPLKSVIIVRKPLVPMFFPILGAHDSVTKIQSLYHFLKEIYAKQPSTLPKMRSQHVKLSTTTRQIVPHNTSKSLSIRSLDFCSNKKSPLPTRR